ncbi:tetratricopeptide repeat-containing sulfotransferase family protein [Sphingomonas oryzagri]|uniref:Sulfotransferase n=1 Tax=Sphingomonas oryzagri TaxID=3042314 RepID=A0ABT6N7J7_9SPHN|nr:tetratricopeptide repeat-containing sulfotransferase family protein [Sphingomonas oryzagri]MDH7641092.1 sulfotransferase [Sphingomonas oryzagri]
MSQPSPQAMRAMERARAGDLAGAIEAGEAALIAAPRDPGLRTFVGVLCCRSGALARGIGHFREALALAPGDRMIRAELARASLAAGDLDAAASAIGEGEDLATPQGREFARMAAHIAAQRGEAEDGAARYARLTQADPADFESWQGLGLARLALGEVEGAADALGRAVRLQPRLALAQLALGRALARLDREAEACAAFAEADALDPDNAAILFELGRAEMARWGFERAEAALLRARALDPRQGATVAALGDLYERTNRLDDLARLIGEAERDGVGEDALALLRARSLRRQGRLEEALAAAEACPLEDDALRLQTIGEIADRLNDAPKAFVAFEQLNTLLLKDDPGADARALGFRETIRSVRRLTTPDWFASWRTPPLAIDDGRRAPAFLYGFPRSGTTLLDTMLMGHPDAVVMEEEHAMQRTMARMGPAERIATLSEAEIADLRAHYWREVDAIVPHAPGQLVVDKFPLGLVGVAFVHRLFPDARYIFAERHPCDCVLSCFITRFRLNDAMANCLRLADAARLYDMALDVWAHARSVFPLAVHTIRYERMVADVEAELRPLADFLGLSWDERLVDHRGSAARRAYISSPSYAQVTEPLYKRAAGRWTRYADQMAPVLPILAPWCERMGYSL